MWKRFYHCHPCTIRLILLPINALVLLIMLIVTCLPLAKMPEMEFSVLIFWTLKPVIVIECIFAVTTLVIGFLGATKYEPCWEGSYSVFLLLCVFAAGFWMQSNDNIQETIDTLIPTLLNQTRQYRSHIKAGAKELGCLNSTKPWSLIWEDVELTGQQGCKSLITSKVGDFPTLSRTCCAISIVVLILYMLLHCFFFVAVSDSEDDVVVRETAIA